MTDDEKRGIAVRNAKETISNCIALSGVMQDALCRVMDLLKEAGYSNADVIKYPENDLDGVRGMLIQILDVIKEYFP